MKKFFIIAVVAIVHIAVFLWVVSLPSIVPHGVTKLPACTSGE